MTTFALYAGGDLRSEDSFGQSVDLKGVVIQVRRRADCYNH